MKKKKIIHVDDRTIIYVFNKRLLPAQKEFRNYLEGKVKKDDGALLKAFRRAFKHTKYKTPLRRLGISASDFVELKKVFREKMKKEKRMKWIYFLASALGLLMGYWIF